MKKIEKALKIAEKRTGNKEEAKRYAKKLAAGMMDRELDMVAKREGITW